MEHVHFHYIHETGIGIILGAIFGAILYFKNEEEVSFNGEAFFEFILPPIIFAAGYNLRKEKFFAYFGYISIYAILGTVVNFIVTLLIMLALNNAEIFKNQNGIWQLEDANILFFSATMCASDAVAALTLIKADKYPKLFSIVFGEGLVKEN
jgi:NhaP-type Na+/H+ or K+/H+ antiporter